MDSFLILLACLLSTTEVLCAKLNQTNEARSHTSIEVTPQSVKLTAFPPMQYETIKHISPWNHDEYEELCPCYPRGGIPELKQLGNYENDLLRLVVYIFYSKVTDQFYMHIPNHEMQTKIPDVYNNGDTLKLIKNPHDVEMFKMYTNFMQDDDNYVVYPVIRKKKKKHPISDDRIEENGQPIWPYRPHYYDEPVSYPQFDNVPAYNNKINLPAGFIRKRPTDYIPSYYSKNENSLNKPAKYPNYPIVPINNEYYLPNSVGYNKLTPKNIFDRPINEQHGPYPNIASDASMLYPKLKPIEDIMYDKPGKLQEFPFMLKNNIPVNELYKVPTKDREILSLPDDYTHYPNDRVLNTHKNPKWNPYPVQGDDLWYQSNPSSDPWKQKHLINHPQHLQKIRNRPADVMSSPQWIYPDKTTYPKYSKQQNYDPQKYPYIPWYNPDEQTHINPNYDPHSDKFIYGSQKLKIPPKVVPFDKWLQKQVNKIKNPHKDTAFDIYIVRHLLEKTLLENGMRISPDGYIIDLGGRKINMDNLSLRPILIGGPLALRHVIENMDNKLKLPNSPYLKAVLLISSNPMKILGAVPLGSTYLPRGELTYSGEVNGHEHDYNLSNVPLYKINNFRFEKGMDSDDVEHYISNHPNIFQMKRYLAIPRSINNFKTSHSPHVIQSGKTGLGTSSLEELLTYLRPQTGLSNSFEIGPSGDKYQLVNTQSEEVKPAESPETMLSQILINDIEGKTKINEPSEHIMAVPLLFDNKMKSEREFRVKNEHDTNEGKGNVQSEGLEVKREENLQLDQSIANEVWQSHSRSTSTTATEDLLPSHVLSQRSHAPPGFSPPIYRSRFAPVGYISRMVTPGDSIIQLRKQDDRHIIQGAHTPNLWSQIPITEKDEDHIVYGSNQGPIIKGYKQYHFEPDRQKIVIAPHNPEVMSNADLNNSMDLYPGFRIIGGHAATSSGAPLSNKGRSGLFKVLSNNHRS